MGLDQTKSRHPSSQPAWSSGAAHFSPHALLFEDASPLYRGCQGETTIIFFGPSANSVHKSFCALVRYPIGFASALPFTTKHYIYTRQPFFLITYRNHLSEGELLFQNFWVSGQKDFGAQSGFFGTCACDKQKYNRCVTSLNTWSCMTSILIQRIILYYVGVDSKNLLKTDDRRNTQTANMSIDPKILLQICRAHSWRC